LATEIERQAESKKDYIAPTSKLAMELSSTTAEDGTPVGPFPVLTMQNGAAKHFSMTPIFHDQLATRLEIPSKYYDRMQVEAPALLAGNVNHWLKAQNKKVMVRTLDGKARAFMSDRYRPLDNIDLAEAVLPIISDRKWEIRDCDLTERKLYIKVVNPAISAVVKRGQHGGDHLVHPGLMFSNSEVGMGAVRVTPTLHWPHCFNIALMDEAGTSRFHTGRRDERFGDLATEFFADATRQADDKAFWMKVRDVVSSTLTEELFRRLVAKFNQATEAVIDGDVVQVVTATAKRLGLRESEQASVLKHLISGGDLSLYGLSGAITKMAQDAAVDYDRGTELERAGGEIIELSRSEWKELQAA
jgi:hypothetical protein